MSGALSQKDRALIEAALAAGRARVIPRGVSGRPYPVWDGARLVDAPDDPGTADPRQVRRQTWAARQRRARAGSRRAEILALTAEGLPVAQIAQRLGVADRTVRACLQDAGVPINRLPRAALSALGRAVASRRPENPAIAVRRATVAALYQQGETVAAMCRATGAGEGAVRGDLRKLGLSMKDRPDPMARAA